jgi:signal transduction histidine kinase
VARLSATEALQRLELLAEVSRALDTATDDYQEAARRVAKACVPAFADLCAIELVGPDGHLRTVAYEHDGNSGLNVPAEWAPIRLRATGNRPVLSYYGNEANGAIARARRALRAESLLLAPIAQGGITVGCFVAATGPERRAFRPSALRVGVEVASRLAAALERSMLQREMEAAYKEQARSVRRLRRLATAAAKLAGAATPQDVLDVACLEAQAIQEAEGAMARWWMPDGTVVEAHSGQFDEAVAEQAFDDTEGRRVARRAGWVAYPLLPNQVRRRAALVVFVGRELSSDEELVFASLASLVPVAFERAVGTGAALAQQARVRAVVSTSPVALVGLGPSGEVTLANPAAQRLFGWEAGGAEISLPPIVRPAFLELAELVRSTGEVTNLVVSAEPFELSLSAAPMPAISSGGDDELSVLVGATDLSEIKRAERALVQGQRLEAMGLVAGRVAHDFNNLLTVIIGHTEMLSRKPSKDTQKLAAANINRAARRAAALTQQLLSLGGRQREGATAVDFAAELRDMRRVLERLAGERVTANIDSPHKPVIVAMSPSGAEQVILNLALNACQAMAKQGTSLAIRLTAIPGTLVGAGTSTGQPARHDLGRSGWAVLTVVDDGPGMTEEVRAHCLEPFFTTKDREHGTGLGLPTVYALVTEGGGHLEIESGPGQGTTVAVWLPLSEGMPLAREVEPAHAWPAGKLLSGRALLVEDEEELRDLASRCLQEAGLQVTALADGDAAATVAGPEGLFDILVTDIVLPGRSGLDVARTLGAGQADLPVLFVTGYSPGAGPLPAPSPFVQVLHKPYHPEELVFAVAALLGGGLPDAEPPHLAALTTSG